MWTSAFRDALLYTVDEVDLVFFVFVFFSNYSLPVSLTSFIDIFCIFSLFRTILSRVWKLISTTENDFLPSIQSKFHQLKLTPQKVKFQVSELNFFSLY